MEKLLSKDIILAHTTQEEIYMKFLGVNSLPKKMIFSNPFSETDKNPSFSLYYENNILKFNGFNETNRNGDVFQFVADLKNLDCKTQFKEVLESIVTEMNINLSQTPQPKPKKIVAENKPKVLHITKRPFTEMDLDFWGRLGVKKEVLERYKVHSLSEHHFDNNKPYQTQKDSICFAYEINGLFKKYTPAQPTLGINKQLLPHINGVIFGLEQLGAEKKENIIICEGEKDVIVASAKGFYAITFGSATCKPTKSQINILQKLCENLFVCYDDDDAGINGRNELIKIYPNIKPIVLLNTEKIKGYDVTDYFAQNTAEDFHKLLNLALKNESVEGDSETEHNIIHITENYILKNYDVRLNIISQDDEISPKNKENFKSLVINSLWREMRKKGIKVSVPLITSLIGSDFVEQFNPLIDYFKHITIWDTKTDYIRQYANYLTLQEGESMEQFEYHFKKWCVRSVKCATINTYFNKNAIVLSDDAKGQNIGKSTWIRYLCPPKLENYIKENLPKDDKDAKISLTQNFIINLDEMASLSKTDVNALKSFLSADKIKIRLPYGKKDVIMYRVANFIGSTNMSTFLQDETGSVRWLCFIVEKIDFSYKPNFNMDNLWSQAVYLAKDKSFDEKISFADIQMNEERNNKFQIQTAEKDLLLKYFEVPKDKDYEVLSTTEIFTYLKGFAPTVNINQMLLGKALTSLKYEKIRTAQNTKYAVKKI